MLNPQLSRRLLLGTTSAAAGVAGLASFGLSLTYAERALATPEGTVDLDILFIGAHPDDEASSLGAYGQWVEALDLKAGIVTVTRGEGGGNAIGFEDGPDLGLLREAEERSAVGYAGIEHVFNLDGLDFFYTASAPLSDRIWGEDALLSRIVRVIRATRPKLLVTMNPAAVQGNHGNHQQAAVYAVEAYFAAADPKRFPEHMEEGFAPWRPQRILRQGATGQGTNGPDAVASGFKQSDPTDLVYGAWNGTWSDKYGERWSTRRDKAISAYASQGWASREPLPTDPAAIPVAWFTLMESRAPIYDPRRDDLAALDGIFRIPTGGLPQGTEIVLTTEQFNIVAGSTFTIQVAIFSPTSLGNVTVDADLPEGWVSSSQRVNVPADSRTTVDLEVTVPASASTNSRVQLWINVVAGAGSGRGAKVMRIVSAMHSEMQPLPEIAVFRKWTQANDVEHLNGLIPIFTSIGSGKSRDLAFHVLNDSDSSQTGTFSLDLPKGFEAEPENIDLGTVSAGERREVRVTVTNADTSLLVGNAAPDEGAYVLDAIVTSNGNEDRQHNFINLVPTLVVEKATAPIVVDGSVSNGEYPGEPFDITNFWETQPVSPEDLSGRCWVTYDDHAIYIAVEVQDDHPGVWLPPHDIKRPRRVDAVEIAIDPRGNSSDTSTVFNIAVFAATNDPTNGNPPAFARERDNFQGGAENAPGVVVASTVSEPYAGYTLEVKIPLSVLPDNVDPQNLGFNIMVNDSDTDDLTAQSRIAWSAFQGVRADPWRWGILELPELGDLTSNPVAPRIPDTAALSVDSPLSIAQSVTDKVPLGGWAPLHTQQPVFSNGRLSEGKFQMDYKAPLAGRAHIFVLDGDKVLGSQITNLSGSGSVSVDAQESQSDGVRVVASFQAGEEVLAVNIPFLRGDGTSSSPAPSSSTSSHAPSSSSTPSSSVSSKPTEAPTTPTTTGKPKPGLPKTGW